MRQSSGNRQSHGSQVGGQGYHGLGHGGREYKQTKTLEPLKPSTYSSQSLSLSSSSAPSRDGGWNTSCPVYEKIRPEYNAISDPYCPYTRTKQFKKHLTKQLKLEKIPPEQMSKSLSLDLNTGIVMTNSMQERPSSTPADKQFLLNSTTMPTMTISDEPTENVIQSETELEVLKAILSREGYLKRLANLVKRLEKKFKPEIADLLDLLRIASVNVVEAIVEWKKVKKDDERPYLWNGENYLLKMLHDLDPLDQYKVIRKWADFSFTRNPFSVPYPLEHGTQLFTATVMNPNSATAASSTASANMIDGFVIGGGSQSLGKPHLSRKQQALVSSSVHESTKISPYRWDPVSGTFETSGAVAAAARVPVGVVQSFVSNQDMQRIRVAEGVILQAERVYLDSLPMRIQEDKDIEEQQRQRLSAEAEQEAGEEMKTTAERGAKRAKTKTSYRKTPNTEEDSPRSSQPQPKAGHKKSVRDRLAEIAALKEKIEKEKALLEMAEASAAAQQSASRKSTKKAESLRREVRSSALVEAPAAVPTVPVAEGWAEEGEEEDLSDSEEINDHDASTHLSTEEDGGSLEDGGDGSLSHRILPPAVLSLSHRSSASPSASRPSTASEDSYPSSPLSVRNLKDKVKDKPSKKPTLRQKEQKSKKFKQIALQRAAVKIQATVRGWRGMKFARAFKAQAIVSSTLLQKIVRGFCARVRVKAAILRKRASIAIQKRTRGMLTRNRMATMAATVQLSRSATVIQKIWRRMLGLARVSTKKILDQSAREASECINVRNLFPMDVKALSNAIAQALSSPHSSSLPPDEVLHLLRLVNMLLLGASSSASSPSSSSSSEECNGPNLSWEQAMHLTKRSNLFLRRIRSLAHGPISKPPRLIVLTSDVLSLHRALQFHPRWRLDSFEVIGKGAKCCAQLFKWVEAMVQVGNAQMKFFDFIGTQFPEWLPKVLAVQQEAHKAEFQIALAERALTLLQQTIDRDKDDNENLARGARSGARDNARQSGGVYRLREVLEREKELLRSEVEREESVLLKLTEKECEMREDQDETEERSVTVLSRQLEGREFFVRQVAQEYLSLIRSAEGGDTTVEQKLPEVRSRLTSVMTELRELRITHGLLVSQVRSNQKRRRSRKPLASCPEVLVKVNIAAEARALLILATSKKAVLLLDRGIRSEEELHHRPARPLTETDRGTDRDRDRETAVIYQDLCNDEMSKLEEYQQRLVAAHEELEKMSQRTYSELTKMADIEREEQLQLQFSLPNEAEIEENRFEDEKDAKIQRFSRLGFIPQTLLSEAHAPQRNRPVLLAFTRDTPGFLKDKLIHEITSQLPGLFVQLDVTIKGSLGLSLDQIQAALDAKKSVILSVDHGLTQHSRQRFIESYSRLCRCLVPRPYSIFALGDDGNSRPGATGSSVDEVGRYGVSHRDMCQLSDSDIKSSLEKMALILRQLQSSQEIRQRMASFTRAAAASGTTSGAVSAATEGGARSSKPSPRYIITLEALFIAQSDQDQGHKFRMPEDNVASISYRSTQLLLSDPDALVTSLRKMKRGKADKKLCEILKTYITHPSWPQVSDRERREDPLLHLLAEFVEEWTHSEVLTLQRGGIPDTGLFKNSLERIQTVVILCDPIPVSPATSAPTGALTSAATSSAVDNTEDYLNSVKRSGWKTPLTQILKGVLYEMRVAKTVRRIDEQRHAVNVYREAGRVFFDAYDSSTSQSYMTAISIDQIPSLLVPNALSSEMTRAAAAAEAGAGEAGAGEAGGGGGGAEGQPPRNAKEMYLKLINLLKFQKVIKLKGGRKELLCRRENRFIQHLTVRISGHQVLLRCYEAALGEIYFEAYLPEHSAKLTLEIEDQLRLKMVANADTLLERKATETDSSVEILPLVVDRLRINPSRRIISTLTAGAGAGAVGRGTGGGAALTRKAAHQGFSLHLKCSGGAGRLLTQRVLQLHHIPHLLTLRESKETKTLRIIAYEPRTQFTSELRLSRFLRLMLLGEVNDNVSSWFTSLQRRLKLNFKQQPQGQGQGQGPSPYAELMIDPVIYRTVRKVSKRRLILSVSVSVPLGGQQQQEQEEELTLLDLFDPVLCEHFSVLVSKPQILELLHYDHNASLASHNLSNGGRFGAFVTAVTDILRYMKSGGKRGRRGAGGGEGESTIDPSELEIPLEQLLSSRECLEHIARQMEILLERANPVDVRGGYVLKVPIALTFAPSASASAPPGKPSGGGRGGRGEARAGGATLKKSLQLRHTPQLLAKSRGGSLEDVIACRKQPPVVLMEESLNELAAFHAEVSRLKSLEEKAAAERLRQRLLQGDESKSQSRAQTAPHTTAPSERGDGEGDVSEFHSPRSSLWHGSQAEAETEVREGEAAGEREGALSPTETSLSGGVGGGGGLQVYAPPSKLWQQQGQGQGEGEGEKRRVVGEEKLVFDRGVKCNFREDKVKSRWQSHVKASVFETLVWETETEVGRGGAAGGGPRAAAGEVEVEGEVVDRMLRFVVYESKTCLLYEGLIRSQKHLREVLGHGGAELAPLSLSLSPEKRLEMVLYIARRRLEMVRNTTTWDGEVVTDPEAPPYRIEFMSDRVYGLNKITPASVGGDKDLEANADKLIDNGHIRGKKLLRVAKRINGLLLQVVVFELPPNGQVFGGSPTASASASTSVAASASGAAASPAGSHKSRTNNKPSAAASSSSSVSDSSSVVRKKREALECHSPPLIRVIGYDPRTKKSSTIEVSSEAVTEVAGGAYSQYLEPQRRKELAKILIDALAVHFPRGGGFNLLLPWSGSAVKASNVQASAKASWRSSAEKILKRTGKIFRSAMRISSLDLIVSVYAVGLSPDGSLPSGTGTAGDRSVILNFYSSRCSEATEMLLPPEVQIEYLTAAAEAAAAQRQEAQGQGQGQGQGKTFIDIPAGEQRADAIRQFCQFLRAEIAEDPGDSSLRVLEVELLSKDKDRGGAEGEGVTEPIGKILYRQKTPLYCCSPSETEEEMQGQPPSSEYLLTLSNRSLNESDGPEKGVMGRVYEPETGLTLALVYEAEEVMALCASADQPDLLRDLVTARRYLSDLKDKKGDKGGEEGAGEEEEDDFLTEMEKVEWSSKIKTYVSMVCDYIARDIGLSISSGSSPPSPEKGKVKGKAGTGTGGKARLFSRMREGKLETGAGTRTRN